MTHQNETIGYEGHTPRRWNTFHDLLVIFVVLAVLIAAILTGCAIAGLFGGGH